jgi:outer membrane protein assembly factor BamD
MGALEEVVRRFPDTPFARDARLKIDLTNDHLAGKEMEVGRFYMRRGQYVGAINRFKMVIDRFQTTSHVPEALHRLVEAYTALGLAGEAEKAAAILGHNYPGSDWYQDSYGLVTTGRTAEAAQPGVARRLLRSLNPF